MDAFLKKKNVFKDNRDTRKYISMDAFFFFWGGGGGRNIAGIIIIQIKWEIFVICPKIAKIS